MLLLSGCTCYSFAQQTQVDTLLIQLKKAEPGTAHLEILSRLSSAYMSVNPALTYRYASELKKGATKAGNEKKQIDADILMGISWGIRSHYDSAMHYFNHSLNAAQKIKYDIGIGGAYTNIALVYQRLDDEVTSAAYNLKAIPLFERNNYQHGINLCYKNLGDIYAEQKSYTLALNYYTRGLRNYRKAKNLKGEAFMLSAIAGCMLNMDKISEALNYYRQSLKIRLKEGDISGIGYVYSGLGEAYTRMRQYPKGLLYFQKSLTYLEKIKDDHFEFNTYGQIAENYLKQQELTRAKSYAQKSLVLAKRLHSKTGTANALKILSDIMKADGNNSAALAYLSSYLNYSDSIFNDKKLKQISLASLESMQIENATLVKDNELKEEQLSKTQLRIRYYRIVVTLGTVILLLIMSLAAVLYRVNKRRKRLNEILNQQKEKISDYNDRLAALNEEITAQMELTLKQNTELERLNAVKTKLYAIISHDFRSPLTTIKGLISLAHTGDLTAEEMSQSLQRLAMMVDQTLIFLDNLLEWTKGQMDGISISAEVFNLQEPVTENISLFIMQAELKGIRMINKIAQVQLVVADRHMIRLVIRNLLSNAIKFTSSGDVITFEATVKTDHLLISLKDTGVGIPPEVLARLFSKSDYTSYGTAKEKGSGLGLILCRDFINYNHGRIWAESTLGTGSTFYFTLPLADHSLLDTPSKLSKQVIIL